MSNDAETQFAMWAGSEGWTVSKQGWPDFICHRDGAVMAVEVKWSDGLSKAQGDCCLMLAAHGVPTFIWTPPGPLVPFEVAGTAVDPADGPLAYWQALEIDRLAAENRRLEDRLRLTRAETAVALNEMRQRLVVQEDDLAYLIRRAEWDAHRPNRLLAIFRKYPEALLGIRPGRRRRRQSLSVSLSSADESAA